MSETTETVKFEKSEINVSSFGGYPPSTIRTHRPPTLILIGPGNPGLASAYIPFARSLHERTQLPVWLQSLVGHGTPQSWQGIGPEHRLSNQIEMTKHLVRAYLHGVRLICVDHSTSCYIILQLLRETDIGPQIAEVFFLMPVISKPDTLVGSLLYWAITSKLALGFAEFYCSVYNRMPLSWRNWLDKIYYRNASGYKNIPDFPITTPGIFRKGFTLGRELFETKLDLEPFSRFADRLHIFCSDLDELLGSWFRQLKSTVPLIDIKHNTSIRHVFFIDDSERMAEIVAEWISETVHKKKHTLCEHLKP